MTRSWRVTRPLAAGALTGKAVDNAEKRADDRQAALRALSLEDVVKLTGSGASDELIINQVNTTGNLSATFDDGSGDSIATTGNSATASINITAGTLPPSISKAFSTHPLTEDRRVELGK